MYSTTKIIRTISLIGAFAFVTLSPTARAVDPPPEGGYPNGNTAVGTDSLFSLTSGWQNTAVGQDALFFLTGTQENTAVGFRALYANKSAGNTAIGNIALGNNTDGFLNTAVGDVALENNRTGIYNTGIGAAALFRQQDQQ